MYATGVTKLWRKPQWMLKFHYPTYSTILERSPKIHPIVPSSPRSVTGVGMQWRH